MAFWPLLSAVCAIRRMKATYQGPPSRSTPDSINKVSGITLIWILIGLWSAVFLGALDATLVSPIGISQSSYLGTSYLLSVCCFTPLYGRLSDILGRKGAMLLGLVLFTSGTLFSRAIAGMGGGGMMTVSSVAVTDLIPLKQRGLFQGLANILFGLGSGLGGPVGGWINDTIGWRWAFLFQIPFLLLSMLLVALKVNIQLPSDIQEQSTYDKLRSIDWMGSLTLVSGVGCLLLGVSLKTGEDIPWSNPLIWGLFIASFVSIAFFVAVEAWWSPAPVLPMRLLMQRTPMTIALANFITSFTMLYNIPLYFSAVRLTTASQAGQHLLPISVSLSLGSVFCGWVMRRTGKYYYLTLGSAFLTVISSVFVAMWNDNTSVFHLWFDIVPSAFGGSSVITSILIALIANVPRKDMAVATGMSYLFRTSGQVLGVSLSGALVQAVLIPQLREKITGPGSQEIIDRIRHETDFIATLDPPLRKAAVDSYAAALRAVFICQAGVAIGSHEEQEEQDRRLSQSQTPREENGRTPG
ncbi:major facilitator superfamily domain-containing protein [Gautieria morchelliformis]|nr:major facilitator superfamily domain-containing protein [Gautieria morchelliformis]